jgi:propanol-preferring alcohol dehydrogenase
MVLEKPGSPLKASDVAERAPAAGEVALAVSACGVCRTDLHIVDGELADPNLPLIVGHQIVGRITAVGDGVQQHSVGDRVGVPWVGWTCGECEFCRSGRENLCPFAKFTGYTIDGGYAEHAVACADFCFRIPDGYGDLEAAPLLCAGLIGYRAYRLTGDAVRLGIYGFGAAAHVIMQVALHEGRRVFAFTRRGDQAAQRFALELGAEWAGDALGPSPEPLDGAVIFAPAGELIPAALRNSAPGATVVCAGIHMSDIPSFPYALLWKERTLRSVANLTRKDGVEFLALAPRIPVRADVELFPLWQANDALARLREGKIRGAAVLTVGEP